MRLALKLHPDSRCGAASHIEVDVSRPGAGNIVLRYRVMGNVSALAIPPAAAVARCDGLWRHTCFEAFIRTPSNTAYYEFNFAPSLQWAAYRFSGYRSAMQIANEVDAPRAEASTNAASYNLQISLELDRLPDLPNTAPWLLGVCAVIEEASDAKSYWALQHPPGKADFHHADCFAHEIPAASEP